MLLSVIIPTYKRANALKQTYISAIEAISGLDGEIIIINDDATVNQKDILPDAILAPHTTIINNLKSGVAAARNLGASVAKGNLILFIDDDVLISKSNLEKILAIHKHFDNIILSPTWEYTNEIFKTLNSTPFGKFRLKYDYPSTVPRGKPGTEIAGYKQLYLADSLSSFCLSMKRETFINLQGMNENFPFAGCEDQEFSMRAHQAGFRLLIDESNVVIHDESHRLDPETWLKRQYTGVQGFVLFAVLYPEKMKLSLWYENTPINTADSSKLKFKKLMKLILIKDFSITALKKLRAILETLNTPYSILENLYKLQTGAYINKGFQVSYKKLNL